MSSHVPSVDLSGCVARTLGRDVRTLTPLGGGDVALSFRVDLADGGRVFAKTHRDPPPEFFVTEAAGLRWLRDADAVLVPEVLACGDDPAFLVLEWIDEASRAASSSAAEAALGRALATLHRAGAPCFGREDRRTTGSRALPNEPCTTWSEFYRTCRLLPLADKAEKTGALPDADVRSLRGLAERLEVLGGEPEPPSRLHGDLWAGNRLVDRTGASWLIDPAAHGGHREFDLSMMRLFGGFGPEVFAAYEEVHPLAPGWDQRIALHQLAPLVVHAIKFGGSYVRATHEAIASLL